jgi:peroxiredoxin
MHVSPAPVAALAVSLLSCAAAIAPAASHQKASSPGVLLAADAASAPAPAFGLAPSHELIAAPFGDDQLGRWMVQLDGGASPQMLWAFARSLQFGSLSPSQESRVLAHLDQLAKSAPDLAAVLPGVRRLITSLTIGKTAPEIAGVDLDGRPMRLSDSRGKVVVLTFTGEWCGICRSEYPYQRMLLELYGQWPFALLSVESGADPKIALAAKKEHGLLFPSWWDGAPRRAGDDSIASAWGVTGWPTTYVIDADGVIRFVDPRKEDLLKAVRQLLHAG